MSRKDNKSIIDDILSEKSADILPGMDELECLIYRDPSDLPEEDCCDIADAGLIEITRNDVTIKVWESKAKLRLRVTPETKAAISMKRIADIAMDAILAELKKESK